MEESLLENKDKISVIVPVYNMEKYLDKCMNSILNQTYKNLEIILVDDGSKDSSPLMCDDYAKRDERIKVVHKINGGLSDARNAGLEIATGEYIGYVDSDDWIELDMYETMMSACKEHLAELVLCRYNCVSSDDSMIIKKEGSDDVVPLTREELLNIYINGHDKYVIYHSVWCKLYKRELMEGVLFPVGHNSEDIMYSTRAFCNLEKAVYIDRPLYNYVVDRSDSIMNQNRVERMFRDEIPFWREHIEYVSKTVSDYYGDMAAYQFYRRLLFYYVDLCKGTDTRNVAVKIINELKRTKADIDRVYKLEFVTKGDKVRMRTIMLCPKLYYWLVVFYEAVIIPLRTR